MKLFFLKMMVSHLHSSERRASGKAWQWNTCPDVPISRDVDRGSSGQVAWMDSFQLFPKSIWPEMASIFQGLCLSGCHEIVNKFLPLKSTRGAKTPSPGRTMSQSEEQKKNIQYTGSQSNNITAHKCPQWIIHIWSEDGEFDKLSDVSAIA